MIHIRSHEDGSCQDFKCKQFLECSRAKRIRAWSRIELTQWNGYAAPKVNDENLLSLWLFVCLLVLPNSLTSASEGSKTFSNQVEHWIILSNSFSKVIKATVNSILSKNWINKWISRRWNLFFVFSRKNKAIEFVNLKSFLSQPNFGQLRREDKLIMRKNAHPRK